MDAKDMAGIGFTLVTLLLGGGLLWRNWKLPPETSRHWLSKERRAWYRELARREGRYLEIE